MTILESKKKGESWKEFSLKIPHRTGGQCCDLYRKRLIPNGEVVVSENGTICLSNKGRSELFHLRKTLIESKKSKCNSCLRWFPSEVKDFVCLSCEIGKTPKNLIVNKENIPKHIL